MAIEIVANNVNKNLLYSLLKRPREHYLRAIILYLGVRLTTIAATGRNESLQLI
jgi:hypothetical protein